MTNHGFARKKAATWIGALTIVAGILAIFGGQAHAKSSYLSSFNTTYGTSATALNTCSLCHPGGNTNTFNAFATAYGGGHSFPAIENADSDGDGFSNIAEITARTFPGDAASKPATAPPPADTTPPTVGSTNPAGYQTGVAVNVAVTATFREAVKSVSATTFTLRAGTTTVAATVTLSGMTATFTPSTPLANATTYTATITTGVTDLANNALAANFVWSFTTGAAADIIPPTVSSTNPVTGATAVPVAADVTATFSEAVKSVSATTFTLRAGTTSVAGTVTLSGSTATFNPSAPLANATTYTATITTGVTDLANNALAANHVWNFTTGAAADTIPPTVSSMNPAGSQTGVPVNSAVTATFSETMAGASLTTATFTLVDGSGNPVAGTVTSAGATATFAPTAVLANGTTYTATVTTGAKDLAGNGLAQSRAWSFTTITGTSDTDGDGMPDNLDAFPNDNRKGTVPNPMGGQGTTIDTSSTAGTRLMGADAMADTDASLNQTGKPAGFEFANGVIAFRVAGLAPGGTASVVLTFPASIPAGAKIFKIDSGGFHEFPGAVISGNTVTLALTDGGTGDADRVANGVIDDPVGLATPAAATPVASSAPDSSGGGCAVAGTGGGPVDGVGAYGFLALIALGLLVRKAAPGKR
jgi:hypothetical protein